MKQFFIRVAAILFGMFFAVLFVELLLQLMPSVWWKSFVSKNPARYTLYQTHPDIGWVHVPNASMRWQGGGGEFDVPVQVNALGLRDVERSYEKPPNTFRVLLLGDSFANALEVPQPQMFSQRLEVCLTGERSQPVQVINGGMSAYGPGDQLLFFEQEGVKYQPDLVLSSLYVGNDVKDLIRNVDDNMVQSFGGYHFYLEEGKLQKQWIDWANPIDEDISPATQFLRRQSAIYYLLNAPDSRARRELDRLWAAWWPASPAEPTEPPPETINGFPRHAYDGYLIIFARNFPDNAIVPPLYRELWQLFSVIMQTLKESATAHEAELAVVLLPRAAQVHQPMYLRFVAEQTKDYPSLDGSDWSTWDLTAPNRAMQAQLTAQNIPTLDLLPAFRAYDQATGGDPLYYQEDIHLNETGHQLTADLLCEWLLEEQLVPVE